ncbi:hypothetical protein Rhopal_006182-T1 [Rhodotorula paludigena]|uniref:CWH43-like N-terminal domain-containing protein n=1 Tax=Rhodotorula paludigena TaxID=86838 RepID=A0AAV5GKG7_9BASI|nr:hypothetical protein Rhopal_006182-T1 [Rhodotorula paludigena]
MDSVAPSAFLPGLVPIPSTSSLLACISRLATFCNPPSALVNLRPSVYDYSASRASADEEADAFEIAFARSWLEKVVALGSRQLARGQGEADEWEQAVDEAASLLSVLSGPSYGTLLEASTGHRTWGAASIIAHRLASSPTTFFPSAAAPAPFRVLELGSGTGLVGLTAAAVLSRAKHPSSVQVTLSDGGDEPDAVLANLRHNVEANLSLLQSSPAESRLDVQVKRLDWRDYLSPASAPPDSVRYDLLLGADLAYEPGQATLLHAAVSSLLRFPSPRTSPIGVADPTFWLCIPLRPTHTAEQAELASLFPLPSDPPDPALLLLLWIFADGRARFDPSLGAVPFVSHVGAQHQTVFLLGSIATATFYALSLVAERLLRHCRVLTEATEERLLWVAIGYVDVSVGLGAGLALVSTALFRAEDYPVEHAIAFIAFITGISLSALLQTSEVEHLWHEHPDRHDLLEGTALKWICIAMSSAAGVAFCLMTASCGGDARTPPWPKCYRLMSTAFSALCFSIAFYFSTLILDLWLPHRHALRASNPPVWADRTGVHGVLLAPSSPTQAQMQTQRVHLPIGWALHRPKEGRVQLVRRAPTRGMADHPGWDEDGRDWSDFAWFEMGKRAGRRRKKEERER